MRLAVQLYTLRDPLSRDLEPTLKALAGMGVAHVELAGTYGRPAAEFRAALDRAGLAAMSAHVGIEDLRSRLDATLADAATLGTKALVVPWLPRTEYERGWAVVGKELDRLASVLGGRGFALLYHNHDFEFEPEGGRSGFDVLIDSSSLGIELDVGWAWCAGEDPAGVIRRLGPRARMLHLKDMNGDEPRRSEEAGKGGLAWPGILAAARAVGTEWGIVELDECPRDPLESVRASVEFFRRSGVPLS